MFLCVRLQMLCYSTVIQCERRRLFYRCQFCCIRVCWRLQPSRLHLWGVMRIHVLGWSVNGSGAYTAPPNYSRVLVLVALRLLVLFRQIKRLSNPRDRRPHARLFVVDCHCLYDDDAQLEDVAKKRKPRLWRMNRGRKERVITKKRTNVLMCPVANALL